LFAKEKPLKDSWH